MQGRKRLPAIGLVSKEEGTGKSTLINVIAKFFGTNTTKIDSSRIAAKSWCTARKPRTTVGKWKTS
ncbi:MAG: hypothetical protein H7246_11245 [Phycisphaerae bacterium]|nr:hypothetical protein [Saprospiraceae bacterium]